MSDDNIRPIITFIADPANAEHLPKFQPEAVLAAAAKVGELEARVAELVNRAPTDPFIKGDNGDLFLYVAGHGYVLTTTSKVQDVIRLNNNGEIRVAHGISIAGKREYSANRQAIKDADLNVTWFLKFEPYGLGKYLASITIKTPNHSVFMTERFYEAGNNRCRMVSHSPNNVVEVIYDGGVAVKRITTEGPVTTTVVGNSVVTETRLCPRVTLVKGASTVYKLETPNGEVVYTEHVNGAIRNGEQIPGYMSVRGSIYKFRHGDVREKFSYSAGFLQEIA